MLYKDIAKNTRRISKLPPSSIEIILKRADQKLPHKAQTGREITLSLSNDRTFCKRAGIDYNNPNIKIIKTAVADYLLKNYD